MGSADPVAQFIEWQRRAERDAGTARALRWFVRWALGEFPQPEQAASLATADRDGHPYTHGARQASHASWVRILHEPR